MYTVLVKGILLDIVSKEVNLTELPQILPWRENISVFKAKAGAYLGGVGGGVRWGGGGDGALNMDLPNQKNVRKQLIFLQNYSFIFTIILLHMTCVIILLY